jgi:DNA-binding transcriptional ArsR family regulator
MANISPLDALGDPTRRKLFEYLRLGPCPVTELISIVPISQPAVSQHLRVLREAQLVQVEKKGQQRIYRLNPVGLAELRNYAENLWDDVLRAFGDEAERVAKAAQATESEPKKKQIRKRAD